MMDTRISAITKNYIEMEKNYEMLEKIEELKSRGWTGNALEELVEGSARRMMIHGKIVSRLAKD